MAKSMKGGGSGGFRGMSGARKGAKQNNVSKGSVKKDKSAKSGPQHSLFTERFEP